LLGKHHSPLLLGREELSEVHQRMARMVQTRRSIMQWHLAAAAADKMRVVVEVLVVVVETTLLVPLQHNQIQED
jgi:hypothetical protein